MTDNPCNTTSRVHSAASAILRQLGETIDAMSDGDYTSKGALGASIGQHVRHTLDHFRTLADAEPGGDALAYDHRNRGVPVETDRAAATAEIERILGNLEARKDTGPDAECTVCATITCDGAEADLPSTYARELWFVTHHAIHHNALIKSLAHELGITLDEQFGRAPSTLEHDAATNS